MAYASFQVLTRKPASLESPFTTHFYTGLTGSLIVALALLASEVELLPALRSAPHSAWGLLLFIGVLGTAGHPDAGAGLRPAPTAVLDAGDVRADRLCRAGRLAGIRAGARRLGLAGHGGGGGVRRRRRLAERARGGRCAHR